MYSSSCVKRAISLVTPLFLSALSVNSAFAESPVYVGPPSENIRPIIESIHGGNFIQVAEVDMDMDLEIELILRHGDACQGIFENREIGARVSICPWSILDFQSGGWVEFASIPAWRPVWEVNESGQVIGVDFDGRVWEATQGVLLPRLESLSWSGFQDLSPRSREVSGDIPASEQDWIYAVFGGGDKTLILAQDVRSGASNWKVYGGGGLLSEGVSAGGLGVMASHIGYVHFVDLAGGEILSTMSWSVSAEDWEDMWSNPDLGQAIPFSPVRYQSPDQPLSGLWDDSDLENARSIARDNWYLTESRTPIPTGELVLSTVSTTCQRGQCEIRGKIEGNDGVDYMIAFDGRPSASACFTDPFMVSYDPEAQSLDACGSKIFLDWVQP